MWNLCSARVTGRIAIALMAAVYACASPAAAPPKKNPAWSDLTAEQQQILKPLAKDWNTLDAPRRTKWLGIAKRYPAMSATEQKRIQTRMTDWANLTPEQRRVAREQFRKIDKLPPDKRDVVAQEWQEYQQLPDYMKRSLAAEPAKKPVKTEPRSRTRTVQTAPPAPSAQAAPQTPAVQAPPAALAAPAVQNPPVTQAAQPSETPQAPTAASESAPAPAGQTTTN